MRWSSIINFNHLFTKGSCLLTCKDLHRTQDYLSDVSPTQHISQRWRLNIKQTTWSLFFTNKINYFKTFWMIKSLISTICECWDCYCWIYFLSNYLWCLMLWPKIQLSLVLMFQIIFIRWAHRSKMDPLIVDIIKNHIFLIWFRALK